MNTVLIFLCGKCANCFRAKAIASSVCDELNIKYDIFWAEKDIDSFALHNIRVTPSTLIVKDGKTELKISGEIDREEMIKRLKITHQKC